MQSGVKLKTFYDNCDIVLNHWTDYLQQALTIYIQFERDIVQVDDRFNQDNSTLMETRREKLNLWKEGFSTPTEVQLSENTNGKNNLIEMFSFKDWIAIANQDQPHDRDAALWGLFYNCLPDYYKHMESFNILDLTKHMPDSPSQSPSPQTSPPTSPGSAPRLAPVPERWPDDDQSTTGDDIIVAEVEQQILGEKNVHQMVWSVFWGIQRNINKFLLNYSKTITNAAKEMFPDSESSPGNWRLQRVMKRDFGLTRVDLTSYAYTDENGRLGNFKDELVGQLIDIWTTMEQQANEHDNDVTHLNVTGDAIEDEERFEKWKKWKTENKEMFRMKSKHEYPHTVILLYKRLLYLYLMQIVLDRIENFDLKPYDENGNRLSDDVWRRKLMGNCTCIAYAAPFPSSIKVCSRFAVVL